MLAPPAAPIADQPLAWFSLSSAGQMRDVYSLKASSHGWLITYRNRQSLVEQEVDETSCPPVKAVLTEIDSIGTSRAFKTQDIPNVKLITPTSDFSGLDFERPIRIGQNRVLEKITDITGNTLGSLFTKFTDAFRLCRAVTRPLKGDY